MKKLWIILLLLLFCAPLWAQSNDFSGDPDCKAAWPFEDADLDVDIIGNNDWALSDPVSNEVTFKEGAASLELGGGRNGSIIDSALDAGYPHKNGDTNKKFTICYWVNSDSWGGAPLSYPIYAKGEITGDTRSIIIRHVKPTGELRFFIYNTTPSFENVTFGTAFSVNKWYHVGITHDDSTKAYRIRVWDDNASDFLDSDLTGTFTGNITVANGDLHLAQQGPDFFDGKLDEMVVWNRVLTTDEIDAVRSGTFSFGVGGQFIMISKALDWNVKTFFDDFVNGRWKPAA